MKPNRAMSRADTLISVVRKIDMVLEAHPDHPNKKRLLERRAEYVQSLKNLKEYGRETVPKNPVGVNIKVPADVLNAPPIVQEEK
ncbi:MAG: hypothetical protein ACXABY_05350 [Candidatus Thorarchaeota archaeon]